MSPRQASSDVTERQNGAMRARWTSKTIHGVFGKQVLKPDVDKKATHAWLEDGKLQARTEALVVAAQDGVIHTRAYQHRVLRISGVSPDCRRCGAPETIYHILSSCPVYAFTLIKDRHDRVLYQLVKAIAKSLKIPVPAYMRLVGGKAKAGALGGGGREILVDQLIPTRETIRERRPDLVVTDQKQGKIMIFDVACSGERRIKEREKEKWAKYQELAADMAGRNKGYKVSVVPVVVGDLGVVMGAKKSLKQTKL